MTVKLTRPPALDFAIEMNQALTTLNRKWIGDRNLKCAYLFVSVLAAQLIHASARADSCPALPANKVLPLTVGPFVLTSAPGTKTQQDGALDLINDVTIDFKNENVRQTTIGLTTTWIKPITINVTVHNKNRTSMTTPGTVSKEQGLVSLSVTTDGAKDIVITQSGAESHLVSLCAAGSGQ